MMKKILFTIYTSSLGGGAERILTNVVNGLADKTDYEISVLEYAKFGVKKEIFKSNVKILKPIVDMEKASRIEKLIKYFLVHFAPWFLRKLYIKQKFDVEISFNYQIPSFLTSGSKNVYNIQWNHGDIYDLRNKPLNRFLQGISYKKADKIIAISENTRNSILELFPKFEGKIETIYNGTDIADITAKANKETDISLRENSIVFLGRIEDAKNPMELVEYIERLKGDGIDIKLYLLGTGPLENEIAQYIKAKKLQDNVELLGYILEPYPIIKQSKAVCMLSRSEGFPTVFTEGLALGKPFISSPVGGTRELSNGGKCGVIISGYEEFKEAVKEVVLNAQNNKKMGENAKEHMKLFSYETQIDNIIKLIENR